MSAAAERELSREPRALRNRRITEAQLASLEAALALGRKQVAAGERVDVSGLEAFIETIKARLGRENTSGTPRDPDESVAGEAGGSAEVGA
jgi:hypothetical protein